MSQAHLTFFLFPDLGVTISPKAPISQDPVLVMFMSNTKVIPFSFVVLSNYGGMGVADQN